jgi:hypothetical protein
LLDRGEKTRVAISVSMVTGDISVTMVLTDVGKGRSSATVRDQDILSRESAVSHHSLLIHANWQCDEGRDDSRSKNQGDGPSLVAKCVNRSHGQVGSSISYPNKHDVEEGGCVDPEGHRFST